MKKISIVLVVLATAFINLNTVAAQLPGTTTPNASTSSSSTDPDLLECRGEFSRSQLCPPAPSTTPPRVRRPPQPQWHVVVNGDLEDSRQHGEIDTDFGRTEYGIGGHAECPEGTIPLVIAPAGLRHLQDAADHRFATGTFCAPLGSTGPVNIDLSQYVTLRMFNLLVARVEDLERRVGEHDTMIIGINEDQGDDEETLYRHLCADKLDVVTFQQWIDATPARRIELCPAVVVSNDGNRDRYFELQLGAGPMIRNSGQRTLLGLDVSLQLTHLGDEGRGFYIQASSGYAGAVAQHGLPHREFSRFMTVGASFGYAQRLAQNTSRVMLGIGATLRATFVLPDPDRPGSIPDGYIGSQAGLAGFVSVDLARESNSSNVRPFLRLDGALMGGRETIYVGGNSERSLTLAAGLVSEIRLSLGIELR